MNYFKTDKVYKGWVDISNLTDNTFFYVYNGAWDGYVTTENNRKIMYTGVSIDNPTKDYVRRIVLEEQELLNIETFKVIRIKTLNEESLQTIEWAIKELKNSISNQTDGTEKILSMLDTIAEVCDLGGMDNAE